MEKSWGGCGEEVGGDRVEVGGVKLEGGVEVEELNELLG